MAVSVFRTSAAHFLLEDLRRTDICRPASINLYLSSISKRRTFARAYEALMVSLSNHEGEAQLRDLVLRKTRDETYCDDRV